MDEARILLVDDEPLVRGTLARCLRELGMLVSEAACLQEARRFQHAFELLLLDYHLAEGCSLRDLPELQAAHPDAEIVLITGEPDLSLPDPADDERISEVLYKPVDYDDLEGAVKRALERRTQRLVDRRVEAAMSNNRPRITRVLVIDDNPGDAELIEILLSSIDETAYVITRAQRLGEACVRLQTESFDVVITDLGLPDARGLTAVSRLIMAAPETPIIVITGQEDRLTALHTARMGAHNYLMKDDLNADSLARAVFFAVERKQTETRLVHEAHHHPLTGLPNRNLFQERVERGMARARRSGHHVCVLFIDLDGFKAVNDNHGHEAGDAVLVELAERLSASVRDCDTVAHFGGDEFTVLLEDFGTNEQAMAVSRRILRALSAPYEVGDGSVSAPPSIGMAFFPEYSSEEALWKAADEAMYRAKRSGGGVALAGNSQVPRVESIEKQLRRALLSNEFEVHYQGLISAETHRVSGFEALLRWRHPQKGLLGPGTFIESLESSSVIVDVGEWVLRRACREARDAALAGLRLAVNVAAPQLEQRGFAALLEAIAEETGFPARQLDIELTERSLLRDSPIVQENLEGACALGARLVLDDFGTGYSALSYLGQFSIGALKLDRSLVLALGSESVSHTVASAIVSLGHELGMSVVAEGIETSAQASSARKLGCDELQGYLFSMPKASHEIEELGGARRVGA